MIGDVCSIKLTRNFGQGSSFDHKLMEYPPDSRDLFIRTKPKTYAVRLHDLRSPLASLPFERCPSSTNSLRSPNVKGLPTR